MSKKRKVTYVHRLVRHEVNLRVTKHTEDLLVKLTEEIGYLSTFVHELADRMEDIDGSLWDQRHATEVMAGRLVEMARLMPKPEKAGEPDV